MNTMKEKLQSMIGKVVNTSITDSGAITLYLLSDTLHTKTNKELANNPKIGYVKIFSVGDDIFTTKSYSRKSNEEMPGSEVTHAIGFVRSVLCI